jgi:hypothetical protein
MSRLQTLPPLGGRPAGGYDPTLPPLRGRSYEAYRRETVGQLRQLMAEATADVLIWSDTFKRMCRESVARMAYPSGSSVCRAYRSKGTSVEASSRTITCRVGSAALDRYNTVIDPEGVELRDFGRNPVVLWEHGRDPQRGAMPVGTCTSIGVVVGPDGPELIARARFFEGDEFAERLYQRYLRREMAAWSVNVVPKMEFCSPPTREEIRRRPELASCEMMFRKTSLCEFSAVSVPGNQEALSLAS